MKYMTSLILAGFLTGSSPTDRLLDAQGGNILVSDGVHNIKFESTWGPEFDPVQKVSQWLDVAADRSGITIYGEATDVTATVTATEIARVVTISPFVAVTLKTCPTFKCDVKWLTSQMVDGPNEYVFFFSNSNGERKGVYSRISRP